VVLGRAGQVGVPHVDARRRGREVDGELHPGGERRAVGVLDAQHAQPHVAGAVGAAGRVLGAPGAVEEVEPEVRQMGLDRAVAVRVGHGAVAPRRPGGHPARVGAADRLGELLDLPRSELLGPEWVCVPV
jgi:hypothetical protein